MRHLLACHRGDELSAQAAAQELGLSRTGFYKLYSQSLRACAQGHAEKRSVIRPVPNCPWWPFGWSLQTRVRGGDDGKVSGGDPRLSLHAPPR
ncbi:MAG: hypothetical protein MUF81_20435, partial [Verrucomicrobia bacterium]|nr:hypothetical protein [Verrucomicrobiota bacterium]